ncbi:hypothetical protein [Bradyrhizobium sp. STM 3561]|uniref:hypothetical protein n=1 Tax=Bradyrhizobium sp. STM 3561 TaxID=578923 RepID=UPI00388D2D38
MSKDKNGTYDEKDSQERFEAALRGALKTPHEPLKEKPRKVAKKAASKKKEAE